MYGQDKFYAPAARRKEIKENRFYTECLEPAESIKAIVENSADKFAGRNAFGIRVGEGQFKYITFKEFKDQIDALGTAFVEMGLKGKHVAVIGENSYEWCLAWMAVVCGTGVVCNLDRELSVEELGVLLEKGDISAVVYSKDVAAKITEVRQTRSDIT